MNLYSSIRCDIFFHATATTEIYTLSLHDALPISHVAVGGTSRCRGPDALRPRGESRRGPGHRPSRHGWVESCSRRVAIGDRKSTRLNSSHSQTSYAVFCLKKKR